MGICYSCAVLVSSVIAFNVHFAGADGVDFLGDKVQSRWLKGSEETPAVDGPHHYQRRLPLNRAGGAIDSLSSAAHLEDSAAFEQSTKLENFYADKKEGWSEATTKAETTEKNLLSLVSPAAKKARKNLVKTQNTWSSTWSKLHDDLLKFEYLSQPDHIMVNLYNGELQEIFNSLLENVKLATKAQKEHINAMNELEWAFNRDKVPPEDKEDVQADVNKLVESWKTAHKTVGREMRQLPEALLYAALAKWKLSVTETTMRTKQTLEQLQEAIRKGEYQKALDVLTS